MGATLLQRESKTERLNTEAKGSRRVEGGHREEEEEGKKEGGKVQPQQPDGEEGAPARPTGGQKVLWKKMGAVERISELNESSNARARPFTFPLPKGILLDQGEKKGM